MGSNPLTTLISKLQYYIKAKGRHGTHSPFAYRFVEEALHERKDYVYPKSINNNNDSPFFKKIFRIVHLLHLHNIFVSETLADYSFLKSYAPSLFRMWSAIPSSTLIIMEYEEYQAPEITLPDMVFIMLICKNRKYSSRAALDLLFESKEYNCTIDAWDLLFLIKNADFKRKQHFILK